MIDFACVTCVRGCSLPQQKEAAIRHGEVVEVDAALVAVAGDAAALQAEQVSLEKSLLAADRDTQVR